METTASGESWSIFSLKCRAIQTIRPGVSWKKHGFARNDWTGGAVRRLAFYLFKGNTLWKPGVKKAPGGDAGGQVQAVVLRGLTS